MRVLSGYPGPCLRLDDALASTLSFCSFFFSAFFFFAFFLGGRVVDTFLLLTFARFSDVAVPHAPIYARMHAYMYALRAQVHAFLRQG